MTFFQEGEAPTPMIPSLRHRDAAAGYEVSGTSAVRLLAERE
jgi:hypothetical protein